MMLQKIKDGRCDLVFEWVANGHSPAATCEDGVSLIQWCAYHGDVSAIKFLCSKGVALDALGENFDLNGACFHGHWELCQFLIESGADVNQPLTDTGETPLHAALTKANRPVYEHIVALLLSAGANPNSTTNEGVETGSFMRDCKTKGETPLHRAAAFGSAKTIQMLLDAGADRQLKDMHGDSPLAWASWHLRPAHIIRSLCYGDYAVHPDNQADYDHGSGWGHNDPPMRGKPHR